MIMADTVRFIESVAGMVTSEEVGAGFAACFKPYGFIAFACGEGRRTPMGIVHDFFFNTWPAEWLRHYRENDYVRHDIMAFMARLTAQPFSWYEAVADRQLTAKQQEFNAWIFGLGIVDGFAVPIHYPGGDFGLIVSCADHLIVDVTERLALHMASIYAHQRCRELGGLFEASSVKTPLTARETECLRWVLKGKSDTDIAALLNISAATVHFHIERVKQKLGVRTRTQAAALVVSLGYI